MTYTNWWHDRKGNFFSHHTEDCVLFVPFSPYFGKWDDAPCGSTSAFGIDQGQINPFICQFCKYSDQYSHSNKVNISTNIMLSQSKLFSI